ncbi:uncharacterized protein [Rutidosis leptorrhynchoides]|uniref:uncharacterized protein n=1 Tax=Rutidosis leptorrhynchoides TaxID=125765 RepID=UPI003A98F5F2
MKLNSLYDQIRDEKIFGYLRGETSPNASEIDKVIVAKIPDKDDDPELYSLVSDFTMHGPCGEKHKECPCMRRGTCSKGFPKDFTDESHFDGDGFPIYRRRNDGNFIMKKGEKLDNSKGPNRISAHFQANNNANASCEAAWRLFNYEIVFRSPAVYRLSFHLPNQQPIVYDGDDSMERVINKPSIGASQFIEWMNSIEKISKQDNTHMLNFLAIMFGINHQESGPRGKESCYAMGLLNDDKEYIASIKEVHQCSTGNAYRSLFVSLITTDSITFPDRVWKETCDLLSDDLTRPERLKFNDPETFKRVLQNLALSRIEKDLNSAVYSLRNIPYMPFPNLEFIQSSLNTLIQDEISYDIENLKEEH